jgi:thiamine-phosphate pyrophosphorylase
MLVTDRHVTRNLIDTLVQACAGGLRLIQVREKDLSDADLLDLLLTLQKVLPRDVTFLVNDRVHLAQQLGMGAHCPRLQKAAHFFWGSSVHNTVELEYAIANQADYVVLGTMFATLSKPGLQPSGLKWLREASQQTLVPLFAIGGINISNASQVMANGAYGIAVCRAILAAEDPRKAVEEFHLVIGG